MYEIFFVPLCTEYTHMKRFLYILAVLIVSLLLVGTMLVRALMSDEVETAAVQLVTAEFSRALGTEAHVGAIEYRFPARLAIRDVYIEDQQQDTLVYVGEVFAHFRPLPLYHGEIRFSHVRLSDVVANLYHLPDSTWNYSFLTGRLPKREKKERGPLRSLISVQDVQLDRIRLRYDDLLAELEYADMDLHQLSEELLDAQISEFKAQVRKRGNRSQRLDIQSLRAHMIWSLL